MTLEQKAALAKQASRTLASMGEMDRARGIRAMADALETQVGEIMSANRQDVEEAEKTAIPGPMLKRLSLTPSKVSGMAAALREVAALPDALGQVIETIARPNGLVIRKIRVPFGVVGVIYESRPNVTSDAAGLCIKSGNSVVLRGGKEAIRTNVRIVEALRDGLEAAGLPADCIQIVENLDRSEAVKMMTLRGGLDLLLPRGGANLIRTVVDNATVPVIETGAGNCHVYVDRAADLEMAASIVVNAKCSNPPVCNAAEKLLVHRDIAGRFLPDVVARLRSAGVEVRGCPEARRVVPDLAPAVEDGWDAEYLDLIMAIRVVEDVHEAVSHINAHGTMHSEAIVTEDRTASSVFTSGVDAATVYVNASTRFTDGGEFGFGAEMGISTQKLHVRGPIGVREMTTYKYVVEGSGQVR